MSRFYAEIQGNRGEATRGGSRSIRGHIRGWNVGVEVVGTPDSDGVDEFVVYATGGSNDCGSRKVVATITLDENGEVVVV